jgi:kynurenine formamidase
LSAKDIIFAHNVVQPLLILSSTHSQKDMASTYLDLSQTLHNNITTFPGAPQPDFDIIHTIPQHGYTERRIQMSSHMGTHIDAPIHILPNTKTLDQFPLEKFIGPATVIDCSKCQSITTMHLKSYQEKIAAHDFLLFYTGWQHKWGQKTYANGFPALEPAATQWLSQFPLKAIGFDVLSPDPVDSQLLPNHKILLAKEILIIENMTNLDQVLDQSFQLYCLPLPIQGADGAPVRVFAQLLNKT